MREGGLSLLMNAALIGHEEMVQMLLQRSAEVDLQNSSGETALMHAASKGQAQMVDLLVQHGAKANLQSYSGKTALMSAAKEGHEQVVDTLLRWHTLSVTARWPTCKTARAGLR